MFSTYPQSQNTTNDYRSDIDGIRAIAVCLVIGFHSFPSLVPGGFIGVDIFFVISGYLITKILIQSQLEKKFNLIDFYIRRVRRIFPALLTVLVSVYLIGFLYFTASEFKQLGDHIFGSSLFFLNFILLSESGYFDISVERKPLLHLWSLSIEEQFYIWLPLYLWLCYRLRGDIIKWLTFAILLSFGLNLYYSSYVPDSAFFLPQCRFWELLLGSALAALEANKKIYFVSDRRFTSTLGFSALLLIAIGVWGLDSQVSYPGAWAFLPCLGAFFLITAGPHAPTNKYLLSNRLMVWLGQISYPLYLWHWVLLSTCTVFENTRPSINTRLLLVVLAVALAQGTHISIEAFFRFGPSARTKALVLGLSLFCLGLLGAYTYNEDGLPERAFASRYTHVSEAMSDWKPSDGLLSRRYFGHNVLATSDESPEILFFGDSHVEQFGPAIAELAETKNLPPTAILSGGGCPPIPNVFEDNMSYCASTVSALLDMLSKSSSIKTVVIGACWNCYLINETRDDPKTKNRFNYYFKDETRREFFRGGIGADLALEALESLIKSISQKYKVILLLDNPSGDAYSPTSMISSRFEMTKLVAQSHTQRLDPEQYQLNQRLWGLANKLNIQAIDQISYLCPELDCPRISNDGKPLYKDDHHFRPFFVRSMTKMFDILHNER